MTTAERTTLRITTAGAAAAAAFAATPALADAAFENQVLTEGTESSDVETLQHHLKDEGYFTYHTATGYYGTITTRAVREFQRDHNLTVDGIAGPETLGTLLTAQDDDSAIEAAAETAANTEVSLTESTRVLRAGDDGRKVKQLQNELQDTGHFSGEPDGYYGRGTSRAVRAFQTEHNLTVDGIAGPETYAALRTVRQADGIVVETSEPETSARSLRSGTFETIEDLAGAMLSPNDGGASRTLSPGDRGNAVSLIQQQLKSEGYYNFEITGIYGPVTETAVRDFQASRGLETHGRVGEAVLSALKTPDAPDEAEETNEDVLFAADTLLTTGTQNGNVTLLQEHLHNLGHLGMEPTGFYGSVTAGAVERFQREHNLTADGIAGPNTLAALSEVINGEVPEDTTSEPEPSPSAGTGADMTNLVANAAEHIGTPYEWGGNGPDTFDCSGFLVHIFQDIGIELPRTVAAIYDAGTAVDEPSVGDIVFFETYAPGPSHAGVYIGGGEFVHAGSSSGVTTNSMDNSYWSERYIGVKTYAGA
ncbi:putative peptidoglycan binding protein [Salsuginibacillus halophilus]|uniref:Putative peptidoglycan binding protein n=1 Tax=Salsuginibacillus halophilus TaxID=517424 RepID=A0A2P8HHS5_9BACI|nr:peptidoglycan-binding protein [Salsuginibacillus halophilus]PSL45751.1 putative peptidoglycan binding protein [Salsuginibacillus halophilus]